MPQLASTAERVSQLWLEDADNDKVKEVLAAFFHKLPSTPHSSHTESLELLEDIIIRVPKNCLTHRNTIENFLVQFVDSEDEYDVICAAKCCHALQQVRPSNDKTATAKSSWRQQLAQLCSVAHDLMGTAFNNAVDIYKSGGYFLNGDSDNSAVKTPLTATLSQLSTDLSRVTDKDKSDHATLSPMMKNTLLCNRLRNVFTFVQAMLVEVYPVAKPVRPQMILDAVVRALSVTSGAQRLPMKDSERQTMSENIAAVKMQALRTLDALIICLGPNLIPYSPLVFRLVTQTLRWSTEHPTEEAGQVRCRSYESLSLWLSTLHCHKLDAELNRSKGKCLEEELLAMLLDDVTPKRQIISLTMSNQFTKNLSKKARRKMANNQLIKSGIAHHMPGASDKNKAAVSKVNSTVVIAALNCLDVLLTTSGIFLKPASHKKVQECLVRQGYALAELDYEQGLALCRALEACRLSAPPGTPPPTQHCLHIYTCAVNTTHREISQFCTSALHNIRLSLHSAPPTLTFSLERPVLSDQETERSRLTVSEKNRAALESLLGVDRLPLPETSKEVITILDDSAFHKRKSKDDVEQISLDSDNSVEVEIDSTNGIDLDSADDDFGGEIPEIDNSSIKDDSDVKIHEDNIDGLEMLSDMAVKPLKIAESSLKDIHEMSTQVTVEQKSNVSITELEESDNSIEITYDCQNSEKKVTILEKMDGDNLPSTNETDDIQITCGQTLINSQDSGVDKKSPDVRKPVLVIDDDDVVMIDDDKNKVKDTSLNDDLAKNGTTVSVEEMLADFVDEVV